MRKVKTHKVTKNAFIDVADGTYELEKGDEIVIVNDKDIKGAYLGPVEDLEDYSGYKWTLYWGWEKNDIGTEDEVWAYAIFLPDGQEVYESGFDYAGDTDAMDAALEYIDVFAKDGR